MPKGSNASTKNPTVVVPKGTGKSPWKHTIKINHLIVKVEQSQPISNEIAAQVANEMAEIIRAEAMFGSFLVGHPNFDFCLLALTDSFERLKADSYAETQDYSAADDFKLLTAQLAEWAKAENIYLGNAVR